MAVPLVGYIADVVGIETLRPSPVIVDGCGAAKRSLARIVNAEVGLIEFSVTSVQQ